MVLAWEGGRLMVATPEGAVKATLVRRHLPPSVQLGQCVELTATLHTAELELGKARSTFSASPGSLLGSSAGSAAGGVGSSGATFRTLDVADSVAIPSPAGGRSRTLRFRSVMLRAAEVKERELGGRGKRKERDDWV